MNEAVQHNNKAKAWVKAMRLRTLPLSFSTILMGTSLAITFGDSSLNPHEFGGHNWLIFWMTILTTLFLQVLSNFANDYGDALKGADNEGRIGPERAIQSGILSKKEMRNGIIITALLAFISGIILLVFSFGKDLNWMFFSFIILGILSIAAAIKYTVGKRAYGYSGMGDLFVFIFFGLVGVLGTYYLQAQRLGWMLVPPAITMGCFSVAVLNLNNMRDQVNDKKVGKNTLAVLLGFKGSKIYHFTIFVIAYAVFPIPLMISAPFAWPIYLVILPILFFHILHLIKVFKVESPKAFDPELKKIALSAFAFSLGLFIILLIFRYS